MRTDWEVIYKTASGHVNSRRGLSEVEAGRLAAMVRSNGVEDVAIVPPTHAQASADLVGVGL